MLSWVQKKVIFKNIFRNQSVNVNLDHTETALQILIYNGMTSHYSANSVGSHLLGCSSSY
jgi:hypothetical protein